MTGGEGIQRDRSQRRVRVFFGCIGLAILLPALTAGAFVSWLLLSGSSSAGKQASGEGSPTSASIIGATRSLKTTVADVHTIPMAVDQATLDQSYNTIFAKDEEGMNELFASGRLFAPDAGTKINVLATHGFIDVTFEVRILEGPYKGRRGFVGASYVSEN